MVSKSAANRYRLARRRAVDLSQVAGPARREGEACLVSPPLFVAPVPPLPGSGGPVAQQVPGELPPAGQQPFRQLGPPGVTAARQPRAPPLRHPRASVTAAATHRPPASGADDTSPGPSPLTRRTPLVLTKLCLLRTILLRTISSIVTIPLTV
jgi:hypothetical protein